MKSDIGKMRGGISMRGTRCKYCYRCGSYSCVDCKSGKRDAFMVDKELLLADFLGRKSRGGLGIKRLLFGDFVFLVLASLADMVAIIYFDEVVKAFFHWVFVASIILNIIVCVVYLLYNVIRLASLEKRIHGIVGRLRDL